MLAYNDVRRESKFAGDSNVDNLFQLVFTYNGTCFTCFTSLVVRIGSVMQNSLELKR